MKFKKQHKKEGGQSSEMPPGKEKAPKPRPETAPAEPVESDASTAKPKGRESDDEVIAPDGEPEPETKAPPLF